MSDLRRIIESPVYQGVEEIISYTLDTSPWGSSPGTISVKVYDKADNSDVTGTVMPTNSPSVSGDVITLSPLKSLTTGHSYRIEIKFVCSGNTFEAWGVVVADD